MKLIVNADDFGTTKGVTDGILDAMHNGIVTDTSLIINTPHLEYAIEQADAYGIKSMGLHLTLTYRKPLLSAEEVPSLVDHQGYFYRSPDELRDKFDINDIEKEFRAQITGFLNTGLKLSHLDTHHHIHRLLGDEVADLVVSLADELKVPMRRPDEKYLKTIDLDAVQTTDFFNDDFGGTIENSREEQFISILDHYRDSDGILEIMTHPGYPDEELYQLSSWNDGRLEEIKTLTSPSLIRYLEEHEIILTHFAQID